VESGRITLETIPFDLAEVVKQAVELIRVRASEKGLELKTEIADDVPQMLAGDPTRLRQILINLLGNSLKFTDKGSLSINVSVDHVTSTAVTLHFAIADTGIGIPADKVSTVFENFSQVDASTTRKYGGTGLGLAISRKFVELMNGRIWVESTVGVGSTFHFTADFGIADSTAKGEFRPAITTANATAACRILLADDSEDNVFLIRSYLKNTACSLDVA